MHPTSEKLNTNSKNNNNITIRGNRNKIVGDFNNPLISKASFLFASAPANDIHAYHDTNPVPARKRCVVWIRPTQSMFKVSLGTGKVSSRPDAFLDSASTPFPHSGHTYPTYPLHGALGRWWSIKQTWFLPS